MAADVSPAARGSIPACAGETLRRAQHGHGAGVYPRVCGGNFLDALAHPAAGGLSPRVRGKPLGRS